jgi:membrane protease YdiL (CAAX protease family)
MKIKEILKILLMIILVTLGNYLVILISSLFLQLITSLDTDTLIKTTLFKNVVYTVSILYTIICIFIFYTKEEKKHISIKSILLIIIIGVIFSSFMNILIYKLKNITESECNIFLIIETGILGPILEEYMYRVKILKILDKVYEHKIGNILSILIFAFSHTGINIVYAFFVGIITIYLKEKYETIVYPIIFHITINIVALLLPIILF